MKPYAESCEQNRDPILAVLREVFADHKRVLEIASGTGQRGVRDFGAVNRLAEAQGMVLLLDVTMPANNRTLVWRKVDQP